MTGDSPPIEACISFQLGKAWQHINRRAREALAPHGVTPAHYALLSVLWQDDGRSGTELRERLRLDSATMTGLIDRAVAQGLVARRVDARDRRVNRVWLSERGRRLREPLSVAIAALNDEVAETLSGMAFFDGLKVLAGGA